MLFDIGQDERKEERQEVRDYEVNTNQNIEINWIHNFKFTNKFEDDSYASYKELRH